MSDSTYKTTDIQTAAVLMCLGYKLDDLLRKGRFGKPTKAIFCFADSDSLRRHIVEYANDTVSLPPRKLFGYLRDLKGQVCSIC